MFGKNDQITRNLSVHSLTAAILVTGLMAFGCDKKGGGDSGQTNQSGPSDNNQNEPGKIAIETDSGTVDFNLQAINALDVENSKGDAQASPGSLAIQTSASLLDADPITSIPSDMKNIVATATSIISGPPAGFKIIVKKISFKGDNNEKVVFDSEKGVELAIDGASVDLSGLIQAAKDAGNGVDGEGLGFAVPVGEYKSIELAIEKRAYIKGCLTGLFENHYNETGATDPNWTPLADLSGEHSYCTQDGKDLYAAALPDEGNFAADLTIPTNADFEKTDANNREAEWMKVAISRYPSWPKTASWYDSGIDQPIQNVGTETEEEVISYELKGGFKVEKDKELTLTMVIDMNRLLRYENGAKDHPRDFPTHKNPSFFFDTSFKSNSFIFAGKPGRIYGYEIKSLVCDDSKLTIPGGLLTGSPADATCSSGYFPVNTWMTLITNKEGKAISLNIQPEDDSRLTTLVGSHYRFSDDPWIFAGGSSDKVDIRYNMDGPEENQGFRGTIYDFPADLEAVQPGQTDPFIAYWNLHADSDKDREGNNIYPSNITKFPGNKDSSGVAIFWRKL